MSAEEQAAYFADLPRAAQLVGQLAGKALNLGAPNRRPPCKNRNSPRPGAGNREEKTGTACPQDSGELASRALRA